MRLHRVWAAAAAVWLAVPMVARADSSGGAGESERPWAAGVKPDDQREALSLFQEGNAQLKDSVFIEAAKKYREALKIWDHPAIHYNLALALLNLDQPIELRQHLIAAMKYGPAPIDQEKFDQAKVYLVLVEKQLSHLRISCDEPGAVVTLDGRTLFNGPGKFDDYVRGGPHSVVAAKDGYLTNTVSRTFPGGQDVDLDLKLVSAEQATEYRRRFDQWIPWTVAGSGALLAAVGGLLQFEGIQSINKYDTAASAMGCVPYGCLPSSTVKGYNSTGSALQSTAVTLYAVGGAGIASGLVLLYVNRLQPYHPDDPTKRVEMSLAPIIGPGLGGVSVVMAY